MVVMLKCKNCDPEFESKGVVSDNERMLKTKILQTSESCPSCAQDFFIIVQIFIGNNLNLIIRNAKKIRYHQEHNRFEQLKVFISSIRCHLKHPLLTIIGLPLGEYLLSFKKETSIENT